MENASGAPEGRFKNPALLIVACAIILGFGFWGFNHIKEMERAADAEAALGMQKVGRHHRPLPPPETPAAVPAPAPTTSTTEAAPTEKKTSKSKSKP